MAATYPGFVPTVADRREWTLPRVLARRAQTHGDRVFLQVPSSGVELTYAQTWTLAKKIASGLLSDGHAPGDRLVIMMQNNAEYILAWFGSALAGLAEVPVNTAYRGSFFEHQVSTVAPTGAVVSAEMAHRFVESASACETVRTIYVVGDTGPSDAGASDAEAEEVREALAALRGAGYHARLFRDLYEAEQIALPEVRYTDLAAVFFTSGTTGLSKGVAMSHSHMHFFADEGACLVRLTEDDVYLSVGPLFHGNAQFLAAYPAMITGARFVLHEKFSASRWTSWIRDSGATVTNLVGAMSDFLWKQPARPDDGDNSLRCVWAVPNPYSVADEFKDRFGIAELVENFGLTEISMPILTPYGVPRPPGAAGLAVSDWFDIRLVDPDTDEEVPPGQMGELVVRPKAPWTTCLGYFGMPDRTAEAMRNCWFHTGDGLWRDEEGWYYFADRLKDAIRRRGENISSYEVEQAILAHDAVAECAVIAVPATGLAAEDEVMAIVVLAPDAELPPAEFWAFCDRRLPRFAVPRYLRFATELPKTPSGKVRKVQLREDGIAGAIDNGGHRQPARLPDAVRCDSVADLEDGCAQLAFDALVGAFGGRGREAVTVEVQVAALVELDLDGVHSVVADEAPDRPAAGVPLVDPDVQAGPAERADDRSGRLRPGTGTVPVADDDVAVHPDAVAMQVEEQDAGKVAEAFGHHLVQRPVERRVR
jgi:carnitine-CoA ligase